MFFWVLDYLFKSNSMSAKVIAISSLLSFIIGAAWLNNTDSLLALGLTAIGFCGCVLSYVNFKNQKQSNNNN